jgi:hypothetical protein
MMRAIEHLRFLIEHGELHHVTYRNRGTVWEGLWFYARSKDGFRGYEVAGCVNKNDPDYEDAYKLTQGIGLHVGSYGNG